MKPMSREASPSVSTGPHAESLSARLGSAGDPQPATCFPASASQLPPCRSWECCHAFSVARTVEGKTSLAHRLISPTATMVAALSDGTIWRNYAEESDLAGTYGRSADAHNRHSGPEPPNSIGFLVADSAYVGRPSNRQCRPHHYSAYKPPRLPRSAGRERDRRSLRITAINRRKLSSRFDFVTLRCTMTTDFQFQAPVRGKVIRGGLSSALRELSTICR
jgi:hypothetical protein